jgi:hypothetical protein
MKRGLLFSLVVLLWGISGFAQESAKANASARPSEITAGKNITITLIVDKPASAQGTSIRVWLHRKTNKATLVRT